MNLNSDIENGGRGYPAFTGYPLEKREFLFNSNFVNVLSVVYFYSYNIDTLISYVD